MNAYPGQYTPIDDPHLMRDIKACGAQPCRECPFVSGGFSMTFSGGPKPLPFQWGMLLTQRAMRCHKSMDTGHHLACAGAVQFARMHFPTDLEAMADAMPVSIQRAVEAVPRLPIKTPSEMTDTAYETLL